MECGYEALPPRESRRGSKRRRERQTTAQELPAESDSAKRQSDAPPSYDGVPSQMTYEYLDHTADVQIHAWGPTLEYSFVQAALGMYGYMTEPDKVDVDPECTRFIEAKGHDIASLLFNFLDACLYAFATEDFIAKDMRAIELLTPPKAAAGTPTLAEGGGPPPSTEKDAPLFSLRAVAWGERFSLAKHPQGTEIKAITYSAMQVFTPTHMYSAGATPTTLLGPGPEHDSVVAAVVSPGAEGGDADAEEEQERVVGGSAARGRRRADFDVYVIVDI